MRATAHTQAITLCMVLKEVFPGLWVLQEGFLNVAVPVKNPERKIVVGQADRLRSALQREPVESKAGFEYGLVGQLSLFPLDVEQGP